MSKQTAMQALVDLLKVKDAYKQCMPYIIEIIDEVYLPMEREQIIEAAERWKGTNFAEQYYNETYKGGSNE